MNLRKKIVFIFGTRPEAIKLAPLIIEMQKNDKFIVEICLTGQHKEMLEQVLDVFDIKASVNLELMQENQTLIDFASRALAKVDLYLKNNLPDLVIVHGDTSTALYGALAAYYNKIKIAHVEAGLRTNNKYSPFPEEMNRSLIGRLADFHFAPTETSKINLLNEGIKDDSIFVTGNTVIDALLYTSKRQSNKKFDIPGLKNFDEILRSKVILITMHRRENFGDGLSSICSAIKELAISNKDCHFIYPVHPNPNVLNNVKLHLDNISNIHLIPPLDYNLFVYLMNCSYIILTDSGGVQEEAPSLGKPVLVLRENTERPEALIAGTVKLMGTNKKTIIENVEILLNDQVEYSKMSEAQNPYGDGHASTRISNNILTYFNLTI